MSDKNDNGTGANPSSGEIRESENAQLNGSDKIDQLIAITSEIKTDVSKLKTDVSKLKTDVSELKTDVTENNAKVDALSSKFDGFDYKLDAQDTKIDAQDTKITAQDSALRGRIATFRFWILAGAFAAGGIIVGALANLDKIWN